MKIKRRYQDHITLCTQQLIRYVRGYVFLRTTSVF